VGGGLAGSSLAGAGLRVLVHGRNMGAPANWLDQAVDWVE
jgi:hypothetical protein